jgi:hypothetical protein
LALPTNDKFFFLQKSEHAQSNKDVEYFPVLKEIDFYP